MLPVFTRRFPPPSQFKSPDFENIILFPVWHEQTCTVHMKTHTCTHIDAHTCTQLQRDWKVRVWKQSVGERLLDKRTVTVSLQWHTALFHSLSLSHIYTQPFHWNSIDAHIRVSTCWKIWLCHMCVRIIKSKQCYRKNNIFMIHLS